MKRRICVSAVVITLIISFTPIIIDIAPTVASNLIQVDDSGGKDHLTIQEGVDAALPGDTVLVYAGTYNEDVIITKIINLTGEDRDTTIINASAIGIFVQNVDYVNISGFSIINGSSAGIRMIPSNYSIIENNRVERNDMGIQIIESNNTIVKNNIASNNTNDYGIYLDQSANIIVENNTCNGNQGKGIYIFDNSNNNLISGNNCSGNAYGIYSTGLSFNNYIQNNTLISNSNYGISDFSPGGNNTYESNTILNGGTGFAISTGTNDIRIINSSISNMSEYDIRIGAPNTYLTIINTSFNKSKVRFITTTNIINVQWFLHVNVIDYLGNPVSNANVKVEDNTNGSYNKTYTSDGNGNIKWLKVTEYIEQDNDNDEVGEKRFYAPYKIVAWSNTLVGYAKSIMNKSTTITIILYNGTLLDLEPNWNLISLSRIQSDTDLPTVLQSIEDQFNAVQWYNNTDSNDHWKHNHISKPFYLNDLDEINHSMGLWIHVIDPEGTTLVVFGDVLTSPQNITLYPRWNLVGFPSKTNKTRDIGLGTINFGSDIDSIWTFNSTIQKWIELNETTDYFEIGKGYWIHSRVTKVWNVPL